jgi:glucosinolate gamma-glutamyl hydrolase
MPTAESASKPTRDLTADPSSSRASGTSATATGGKFAVLKTGSAQRETRERQGDFDRMFLDLLAEPGQTWDVFDVEHGHFPADAAAYDGFVITGSPASAYDDLPWLRDLSALLRESHARKQALLGVCFGHQALAQALGGDVQPNPRGWDVGIREVHFAPGAELPAFGSAGGGRATVPQPLRILELHRDAVMRLPPGAVALASSDQTACEMFTLGDHVLGMQGHPEFETDVVRVALGRLQQAGALTTEQIAASTATLSAAPDTAFLRDWLRGFLRARIRTRERVPVPAAPMPAR